MSLRRRCLAGRSLIDHANLIRLFTWHDPARGSDQVAFQKLRVGPGRVGSGRVGSRHEVLEYLMGRVGSGQELFKCHGSGQIVTLTRSVLREVI